MKSDFRQQCRTTKLPCRIKSVFIEICILDREIYILEEGQKIYRRSRNDCTLHLTIRVCAIALSGMSEIGSVCIFDQSFSLEKNY